MIEEKIISSKYEKIIKTLRYCAIGSGIIFFLRLVILDSPLYSGAIVDSVFLLLPLVIYGLYHKRLTLKLNQFVEFKEKEIVFKTKESPIQTIKVEDINKVEIGNHLIIIETSQQNFNIDIEDFNNYKNRVRLKELFSELKSVHRNI